MNVQKFDVIILGAGGAGMMCARTAGLLGKSVALIDHAKKIGGKILISGGGRCNFTNTGASPAQYVSENPHFCKSAFSRYQPSDFIELVQKHRIPFHEKKLGQQFCDRSAQDIVQLLETECREANAKFFLETIISGVEKTNTGFRIQTNRGVFESEKLVVATGGLSIPKIGATDLGYRLAKQFGHTIIPLAPALDGFDLSNTSVESFRTLSGVAVDSTVKSVSRKPAISSLSFRENSLFTHTGLSGPAILQASLHWYPGDTVQINFLPDESAFAWLKKEKDAGNKSLLKNILSLKIPGRLVDHLLQEYFPDHLNSPLPQVPEKMLNDFCEKYIHQFSFVPSSTVGYSKAEVTRGGVNTNEVSSKTLESKKVKGLYFIGEVVDVTGWLGGYNFHWAWASGFCAGESVAV
jgi:predicted Rossmann fold flavoprotein